jgi:hypothetical protein
MRDNDPRWIATVIYSDQGDLDNVFLIEELSEIQSIVERGPERARQDRDPAQPSSTEL